MPTSRTSKFLQGTAVTFFTTIGAFVVWTKHCKFVDLSPHTDSTFQTAFYKKYNPSNNATTHDLCVRKVPLFKLKSGLVEDAQKGGTKLVEGFCAGVWGGFGYTPQRLYLSNKYQNTSTTAHQLWTKQQLLASPYDVGTEITDHFAVLEKTSSTPATSMLAKLTQTQSGPLTPVTQSILIRCGDSPLKREVRDSDGLFEIATFVDTEKGFAEFRLKSVFYKGLGGVTAKPPMEDGSFMLWAHRQYTRLWMESAIRNVMK